MKAAGVLYGALAVAAALQPCARADEAAAEEEGLEGRVRLRQEQIEQKLSIARNRIKRKNFVAARSAIKDAAHRVRGLQSDLPWQKISVRLTIAERKVKAGKWAEAKRALEVAFRELDSQARYIDVTKIWQHLDEARGFVGERRGRLALQELRTAKRFAYLDDIASPLRRALVHLEDARRELLKLPIFFKGKRTAAGDELDAAEDALGRAYATMDKLLQREYATGSQ